MDNKDLIEITGEVIGLNLEAIIMSFVNIMIICGVEVTNKIELEKLILKTIIDYPEDFENILLKYDDLEIIIPLPHTNGEDLIINIKDLVT